MGKLGPCVSDRQVKNKPRDTPWNAAFTKVNADGTLCYEDLLSGKQCSPTASTPPEHTNTRLLSAVGGSTHKRLWCFRVEGGTVRIQVPSYSSLVEGQARA